MNGRLVRAVGLAATATVLADAVRLRQRWWALPQVRAAAGLPTSEAGGEPIPAPAPRAPCAGPAGGTDGSAGAQGWLVVHGPGVAVPPAVVTAAVDHAAGAGLAAVELVPGDVPASRLLDVVRRVDRRRLATDPLAPAAAAGWALVVRADVAERAGVDGGSASDRRVAATALAVRSVSPDGYGVVRVPDWQVGRTVPVRPVGQWVALYGRWAPVALVVRAAGWLVATAGVGVAVRRLLAPRRSGRSRFDALAVAGPLAAAWAAPWVVGGKRRRSLGAGIRPVAELAGVVAGLSGVRAELGGADPWGGLRTDYGAALAGFPDRFVHPRRSSCPWCASAAVRALLKSPDRIQGKPGRFALDRCGHCGLVFQNPRLTDAGLAIAYRDFYDGIGAEQIAGVFEALGVHYRRRAEMLAGRGEPRRWLDVGTGHGHFCAVARTRWPSTQFDGLDQGAAVVEAERRGWVDRAVRGTLVDLAASAPGRYDVVSMYHYLEHTADPAAELDAATALLAPGGHLMVEVPNPDCRWGRLLGSWWMPWFQPQHLNLLPEPTLRRGLEDRGLTVVARDLVGPHQPAELMFVALFAAERLAPDPRLPWHGPPTPARRLARGAVMTAAFPALAAGAAVDRLAAAVLRTPAWSNAYRLLARKLP